jgi:hypothetical protein
MKMKVETFSLSTIFMFFFADAASTIRLLDNPMNFLSFFLLFVSMKGLLAGNFN